MQDKKILVARVFLAYSLLVSVVMGAGAPIQAHANLEEGLYPFGGYLFGLPCTCNPSYSWVVVFHPEVGGIFEYINFTQSYLNFNFPQTRVALGLYDVRERGGCFMGVQPFCFMMPSMGTINYTTGSSKL